MNEPTVNIPLLRKAVEWAEAEAAKPIELCEWEQGDWVADATKRAIIVEKGVVDETDQRLALKAPDCGTCYCIAGYIDQVILGNRLDPNFTLMVEYRARDAMGIDAGMAGELFDPDNTIEDVRRIAESIAGESL